METINNVTSYRIHRVGTITAGFSMIVFGVLLLLRSMYGLLDYNFIFSLWPVILIGLGVELLLSNCFAKQIVYDKGSLVLLIIMTFFAIGMAVTELCMEITELHMLNRIS